MTQDTHRARKRFGQNFLQDQGLINRLVHLINPQPEDAVVEIGPGQGALTEPLLQTLTSLDAVEIDRDLVALLREKFQGKPLTIHESDALQYDFNQLIDNQPIRVIGNLPYNISTPLIFHLLDYQTAIKDMHFMLQLEVVERLAAKPGTKAYGRISVISQYYCDVAQCFLVPPTAFHPQPKVMSAIVKLTPRPFSIRVQNDDLFIRLVKACFAQRRKTLKNNLKSILTSEQMQQLDCDLSLRPEALPVEMYVKLTNTIDALWGADGLLDSPKKKTIGKKHKKDVQK
ncbi:MAG: 16S rRNA (adenine(1518)-N(6)/adenine(1519)-N(6))-dimethyltransferase RsmA [Cellvibrionales bacterium]|nr:16S rRNA (adenine(1518)-N(6)/adenine(1519)-N(6))-dimethyltransferase RsmA [Cellvibrionales bacterium]